MTVTIELKPETARRLVEKAREKGLEIETFIESFLEENFDGKVETGSEKTEEKEKPFYETATKEEWIAEFERWVDSHKDKDYPILPDEAYSRESIYEDRF